MNISNLTFRNAAVEDLTSIMKVEHSAFSAAIWEKEEVFLERIATYPEGFRVMEWDGEIIGYISSELWERTYRLTKELFTLGHSIKKRHHSHGREVYISSMGLRPEYRSLGLGKVMFSKFIEHIQKQNSFESVILIVSENWSRARSIYVNNGFEEVDVISSFFMYSDKSSYCEDGIVMRKQLE